MNYKTIAFLKFLLVPFLLLASKNNCTILSVEKKIVVLIPSYNNPPEITEACLRSVLMQDYSNFEILFCDDCSPGDNTEQWQQDLIQKLDTNHLITYKRNAQRYGPIGNQWHAFHFINADNSYDNREIIVVNVDGDDLLLHDKVLKKINELHHHDAWLTYGQFCLYPSRDSRNDCRKISDEIIAANKWRSVPGGLATSHIRTYRLSLLKDLPLEALLYEGGFYPAAGDSALMWSLCEKAGFHTAYNAEVCYGYRQTSQNEVRTQGTVIKKCVDHARKQNRFTPLAELPIQKPSSHYKTELIIFSYNRPLQLYALLESIQEYVTGFNSIQVLYRADHNNYHNAYLKVNQQFPAVNFIQQKNPPHDFKPLLIELLNNSQADYLMFATDDDIVKDYCSITKCVAALQKTDAYGFYLRLGTNTNQSYMLSCYQGIPSLIDVGDESYAWQFDKGNYDWAYPHTVDMTLYAKKYIVTDLNTISYHNPNTLESQWASLHPHKTIGLCFSTSKIVNIPMNRVQNTFKDNKHMNGTTPKELLLIFENGYKINYKTFYQWKNNAAHAESNFSYIHR